MRIDEAGGAPSDQGRDPELAKRHRRRARGCAANEKEEGGQSDQSLLGEDLEELIVRIARSVGPPPALAPDVGHVAIEESTGTDAEDRMIAHHAQRMAPEVDAIARRC